MGGAPPTAPATDPKLGEVCKIVSLAHLRKIIEDYPGVFIDFWSPTCPPCMRIKPVFENLAKMNENENIAFCAVNTQEARDAASAFQVSAIPNFVVMHNGKEMVNFKGANEQRLFSVMAELQEKVPAGKVMNAKKHE